MDDQGYVTPQINDMPMKASGNPLQMRGLLHVMSSIYSDGMSLDDLQVSFGTVLQNELRDAIQGMDESQVQVIMSFLQKLDYKLTLDYNKTVRNKR